jgi:hypothetical protein
VQVAVPDEEVPAGPDPVPDEFSPEVLQPGQLDHPMLSGSIPDRRMVVRAALKAGVLGVFIGMIPFLGIVLTGALAVYFYRRESRLVPAPTLGGRIGGAAGIVAFAINGLLLAIRIFVFHAQQEYIDFLTRFAHTMGANAADPDFQAGIHMLLTPAGLAITFFFGMIIALVLASVGGALASLFLRPPNPRM